MRPISSPRLTWSPFSTENRARWPYQVSNPEGWPMMTSPPEPAPWVLRGGRQYSASVVEIKAFTGRTRYSSPSATLNTVQPSTRVAEPVPPRAELLPGVWRLPLPLKDSPLGHVNTYLVKSDNGYLLVDC